MSTQKNNAAFSGTALTGIVLNIQHFCTEDGPGMRTTVFLKGCSLRCEWCCNPESMQPKPELDHHGDKCIGGKACGYCLSVCPTSAIRALADGSIALDRTLCTRCGQCAEICPAKALNMLGQVMTVKEVLDEVEQDSAFYRRSRGGITLSGGECLLQPEFSAALLAEAHKRGMNTAIESAGHVPWEALELVLPHVDTMLHDFKVMEPDQHKKWCGVDNALLLANYQRAYESFPNIKFIARTPVIPGVNDHEAHIRSVLDFIRPHKNVINYELLPYHRFGESKYHCIGKTYTLAHFTPPTPEALRKLRVPIYALFGNKGAKKEGVLATC